MKTLAVEINKQAVAAKDVALPARSTSEFASAEMTRRAADMVYNESGIGVKDVQIMERLECLVPTRCDIRPNVVIERYVSIHLEWGRKAELIYLLQMAIRHLEVNTSSGGFISKCYLIGATGLVQ